VTIFLPLGVVVHVTAYRLLSLVPGVKRSQLCRGWRIERCLNGSWTVLADRIDEDGCDYEVFEPASTGWSDTFRLRLHLHDRDDPAIHRIHLMLRAVIQGPVDLIDDLREVQWRVAPSEDERVEVPSPVPPAPRSISKEEGLPVEKDLPRGDRPTATSPWQSSQASSPLSRASPSLDHRVSPPSQYAPAGADLVIDEGQLFGIGPPEAPLERPRMITELTGLEEVKELGSSRFGAVRLLPDENYRSPSFLSNR
jgi:hypothetical protein